MPKLLTIYPLQYGLIGAALALFYLLLLAVSEQLAFGTAYAITACACVALSTCYVLVSLEDHALLASALSLFDALAIIMIVPRKVDCHRLSNTGAPGTAVMVWQLASDSTRR